MLWSLIFFLFFIVNTRFSVLFFNPFVFNRLRIYVIAYYFWLYFNLSFYCFVFGLFISYVFLYNRINVASWIIIIIYIFWIIGFCVTIVPNMNLNVVFIWFFLNFICFRHKFPFNFFRSDFIRNKILYFMLF